MSFETKKWWTNKDIENLNKGNMSSILHQFDLYHKGYLKETELQNRYNNFYLGNGQLGMFVDALGAQMKLPAGSWLVFDKAYTVYQQFAKWTLQKVWFVTRMKDNADFHVTKVLVDKTMKKNAKGVLKEQYITVAVKQNGIVFSG